MTPYNKILSMIEGVEEWRPVRGFEGLYAVSNRGNVKSLPRIITDTLGRNQPVKEKLLAPNITKRGYLLIRMSDKQKSDTRQLHRMVAEAFFGPSDMVINHKDRNPQNNTVENLEYVSSRENANHWKSGKLPTGVTYQDGRYRAKIYRNGKDNHIGYFCTPELAHAAYVKEVSLMGQDKYVRGNSIEHERNTMIEVR